MIHAHFIKEDDCIKQFSLSGHAESGPDGHDLVCSAVSALAIGTVNNLNRIALIEPKVVANEEEGGFLEVTLPEGLSEKQLEPVQVLLQSLYYSLLDIQGMYGEFISVTQQNID